MVLGRVELRRQMAGRTNVAVFSRGFESRRVRIVTIGAGDTRPVHLALQERCIDIDLLQNLSVGIVKAFIEQRRQVCVGQGPAKLIVRRYHTPPRMTAAAGLRLRKRVRWRLTTLRGPGCLIHLPHSRPGIVQLDAKACTRLVDP